MSTKDLCAAVDLGSNSFRLLLAGHRGDELVTLERLKEKVRLLGGFRDDQLHPGAIDRGLQCLDRFAQRLAVVPRNRLWVIGTHALRTASNAAPLARAVRERLGVNLRVVGGTEEATLIYLGVAHHCALAGEGARLVVDIGGGSTELAWGNGVHCVLPVSAAVGCVALSDEFFQERRDNGAVREAFHRAKEFSKTEIRRALSASPKPIPAAGSVLGTSGTVESVQAVLAANGWDADGISRQGLTELVDAMLSGKWVVDAGLPGLQPERIDIFPAGVALLSAVFEVLELSTMDYINASLQDGVLYRHVAPNPAGDLRRRTIKNLARRYRVDTRQAARVRLTALGLLAGVGGWADGPDEEGLLAAAAELHEIGLGVSEKHYHKHGGYVLQYSDLRGFTAQEQRALAMLVRAHRRALPLVALRGLPQALEQRLFRLLVLLRLAVILHRGHNDADPPNAVLAVHGDTLELTLADGWLARHALSRRELEVEAEQLATAGWRFRVAQ